MIAHYLLVVWDDLEPSLMGPYKTERLRLRAAKGLKKEHGDDHGIYALNLDDGGNNCAHLVVPFVFDFTGAEMGER